MSESNSAAAASTPSAASNPGTPTPPITSAAAATGGGRVISARMFFRGLRGDPKMRNLGTPDLVWQHLIQTAHAGQAKTEIEWNALIGQYKTQAVPVVLPKTVVNPLHKPTVPHVLRGRR